MELWFLLAVVSAILGGFPPFLLKVAAAKNYDARAFVFVASVVLLLVFVPAAFLFNGASNFYWSVFGLGIVTGIIGFYGATMRLQALRYLDATIYFPIVETLIPMFVIISGVFIFNESFAQKEWLGMAVGLATPLFLLSPSEKHRQVNLRKGMWLIVLTSLAFAVTAVINKFNIDQAPAAFLWLLAGGSVGSILAPLGQNLLTSGTKLIPDSLFQTDGKMVIILGALRGVIIATASTLSIYALSIGGPVSIVATILAFYILIPIVLAIIFYNEHWNLQKIIAIVLSVSSLALLG